jgi:hypothetical protein
MTTQPEPNQPQAGEDLRDTAIGVQQWLDANPDMLDDPNEETGSTLRSDIESLAGFALADWNRRAPTGGENGEPVAKVVADAEHYLSFAHHGREIVRGLLNALHTEARKPIPAGWSPTPISAANHAERLCVEDLELAGAALSEWAQEHLSKGYGVSLTVREVARLIAGVKASCASAQPAADKVRRDTEKSCETEPVRQSGLPSAEQGDRSANTSADVPVGAAGGSVSTQSSAGASSSLRSRVQKALTPPTAFADRRSLPATNGAQGEEDYIDVDAEDRRSMSLEALVAAADSQPVTVAGEEDGQIPDWVSGIEVIDVACDRAGVRPLKAEQARIVHHILNAQDERIKGLTAERDALRGRAERYMTAVGRYYTDCHGRVKKTPKHDDPRTAEFRLADDMLRAALTQEAGQ